MFQTKLRPQGNHTLVWILLPRNDGLSFLPRTHPSFLPADDLRLLCQSGPTMNVNGYIKQWEINSISKLNKNTHKDRWKHKVQTPNITKFMPDTKETGMVRKRRRQLLGAFLTNLIIVLSSSLHDNTSSTWTNHFNNQIIFWITRKMSEPSLLLSTLFFFSC